MKTHPYITYMLLLILAIAIGYLYVTKEKYISVCNGSNCIPGIIPVIP